MAERAAFDMSSLGQDLDDASQRRRLWLLGQIIQDLGIDDIPSTLERVEQLENFIVNGLRSDARHQNRVNGGATSETEEDRVLGKPATDAWDREQSAAPLLDEATRSRFIDEAVRDPDNRRLAKMFGLTVRQAHAVRVAFRKVIARRRQAAAGTAPELAEEASEEGPEPRRQINGAPAAARARDAPDPEKPTAASFVAPRNEAKGRRCGKRRAGLGLDRATELRMEEEFLAGKRAPDLTIDDVVRFLRQQGDVVVSEAGGYRVNYGDRISADQLVERANDKRRRRGQQAFVFARNGADHSSVELPAHASG